MIVWLVTGEGFPSRVEIDHGNPVHYLARRPDFRSLSLNYAPLDQQPREREFVFEGYAADGLRVYQEQQCRPSAPSA